PKGSLDQPPSYFLTGQLSSATLTYVGNWDVLYPLKLAYFDPGQHGSGGGGGGHGGSGGGGHGGTGGSGGHGGTSGGTGGRGTGGGTGVISPSQMYGANQYNQPRLIVPD